MERRNFLKTSAAALGLTTTTGAAILTTTDGASATAGSQIPDPPAVTTDDGRITAVAAQTTGRVAWDGFDTPATKARIINDVVLKRGGIIGEYRIHDTGIFSLTGDWGGDGEETHLAGDHEAGQSGYIAADVDWGILQQNRENTYNDGYGLPENPAPTAPLYADADGSTQETKVILKSTYLLYTENEGELTGQSGYPDRPKASTPFVVTVNNEKSSTSFGDDDAEGDSDDSAVVVE